MPVAFFQVTLTVKAKRGGEAELVPPKVLQDMDYQFVIVKEGGAEGIVQIEASETKLKEVGGDKECKLLTARQKEKLQESYPLPKLKKKYRTRSQDQAAGEVASVGGAFEVDEQGQPIVDTLQTVRSGFYLIDVPILTSPTEK